MAPRRKATALKEIDSNVAPPMTPRRLEITSLKAQLEQRDQENESLRSEMASLSSKLESVRIESNSESTVSAAPVPAVKIPAPIVPAPDLSLLDAKLPDAPVRPASAFAFFSNITRKTLKDSHPNTKATEQSKIIGQMWKDLSATDRKEYEDMHEQDRTRYELQMKKYQAAADKVEIEKKSLAKLYENRKQALAMEWYEAVLATQPKTAAASKVDKAKTEREPPKKPKTAFNIFCAERRESLSKSCDPSAKLDFGENMKLFSQEWSKLDSTKAGKKKLAKYHDLASNDKERYNSELEQYNTDLAQDKASQIAEASRKMELERKLAVKTYASEIQAEAAAKEQRRAAQIEKKEKKAQRDLEPKRPKSAYIYFSMATREAVASEMPGASQASLMEALGRRWREASPDIKKRFEDMSAADKDRYKSEMDAFKAQSTSA
jgi:HMG (high mobility group) box